MHTLILEDMLDPQLPFIRTRDTNIQAEMAPVYFAGRYSDSGDLYPYALHSTETPDGASDSYAGTSS